MEPLISLMILLRNIRRRREYAAKSQLYIGLCYEKLGNTRLARHTSIWWREDIDQSDIVSQARERLVVLTSAGGPDDNYLLKEKLEANNCM